MTGEEFYRKRMAMHVLIDHFLGEDWYVTMPENDDQVITVAVAEILNKYPKNRFSAFVKKICKLLK